MNTNSLISTIGKMKYCTICYLEHNPELVTKDENMQKFVRDMLSMVDLIAQGKIKVEVCDDGQGDNTRNDNA